MRNLSTLLILLFLVSCETYEDAPFKKFTIKKGNHYASVLRKVNLETPYLSYDIYFDQSAVYETKNPNNQADINKLFGFSDCNNNHLNNSIRFGWNWSGESLDIYSYQHLNGDILWSKLGSVEIGKVYRYNIFLFEWYYELEIEGLTKKRIRIRREGTICEIGFYYQLFPYFGGDETAPHDISIYFKRNHKQPQ